MHNFSSGPMSFARLLYSMVDAKRILLLTCCAGQQVTHCCVLADSFRVASVMMYAHFVCMPSPSC